MAIAVAPSFSLEGICCSTSSGVISGSARFSFEGGRVADLAGIRFRNPSFGANQIQWLSLGRDNCLSKVQVAADYSDSLPDSSNYLGNGGYHPLEELKTCKKTRETKLTCAEIARTTVEAHSSALLVFPGVVHREPHERISWADFQYVVDDYGDIFFEIFDDENILLHRGASNPVNALIGMDIPIQGDGIAAREYTNMDIGTSADISADDDYFEEIIRSEVSDIPVDWGMPDTSRLVHPIYFAKCLTKAVNMEYGKRMDHPSNGISILGCLRPTFIDEEPYVRRLFHFEENDGYTSEWEVKDLTDEHTYGIPSFDPSGICVLGGQIVNSISTSDGNSTSSTFYRLEIMKIELFSIYGIQSVINLEDFLEAEPDGLLYSTSAIIENFGGNGILCNVALKALCKKKGLHVERAHLIGVDSLGIDVRVFYGVEVQTHRFPFKVRVTSEVAAEKQIQQLLFPRSRRKKLRTDGLRDRDIY